MTAALLAQHAPRIRSFRHTGHREDYLVPRHPIVCVNGIEVDPLKGIPATTTPESIFHLARQLSAHNKALVFQYGDYYHH